MTKARDLANASTALSTVSPTELGYLDGVTSAVQTQIDAKLATSTAATTYVANSLADAKGDIFVASADNTVTRLPVGSTGDTIVADSSTSTGLRYQAPVNTNPVINSAFQVWQRGTTFASIGSTQYSADRWYYGNGGTSNYTISRQVTSDTTNLPNVQYCARLARASGNTNTAAQYFANVFETINTIPYVGKTITLSYYARVGANWSGTGFNGIVATGTSTDASFFSGPASTSVLTSAPTLTTTWQRFTATGTVGTTATQMSVYFVWSPSGTAGANDYVEITGVQVEVGSVATPFKTYAGTIQGELAACQRYYYRQTALAGTAYTRFTGFSPADSTTLIGLVIQNPVQMRVAPTSVDYGSLTLYGGAFGTLTSLAIAGENNSLVSMVNVTGSGLTQYRPYALIANASASAYLGFSAEL